MKANPLFLRQRKPFWANVRSISQFIGYTDRQTSQIKVPSLADMQNALTSLGLDTSHIVNSSNRPTIFGRRLHKYFFHRADILNTYVRPRLMDVSKAKQVFNDLFDSLKPNCPIPLNKQKNEKKAPAYFTAIINMLIESNSAGFSCDYDPRVLTAITHENLPLRTLARRVDGAFTSPINPIAIWEIKEYYYTTTFGSRVADGVYETLLDGMELEEIAEHEKINIKHYLMIDDFNTWWNMGRSYLCRIVDMLHMGYIDEVFFGYEVVEKLPATVKEWVEIAKRR
jgi:hypothetical protein